MIARRDVLRFALYVCVGAAGTAVQYALLFGLVSTRLAGPVLASSLGAVAGALVNYLLNYTVTFRSSRPHRSVAPRFFTVAAAGIAINSVVMAGLTHRLGVPYLLAQLVATGCVLVTTYVANSIWSFRHHEA